MSHAHDNVLLRQDRLRWSNRVARWRADPAQSGFHALALGLMALLALGLLMAQRESLLALWQLATTRPALPLGLLGVFAAIDQRAAQRRLLAGWRSDWLAAQPLQAEARRAYRWRRGLRRAGVQVLALALLLGALSAAPEALAAVLLAHAGGALLGGLSADRNWPRPRRAVRHGLFAPRGRGRLWRWQRQAAGLALLPRHLAPLFALWLLVPRGPLLMAGVALFLLGLGLLASAFRRMLGVLADAEAWLAAEGIAARRWVPRALLLPSLLLATGGVLSALLLFGLDAQPAFYALLAAVVMVAGLALLAAAAERRHPRRLALVLPLHLALLLGCAQALPPLLPLCWLLQCGVLLRRSLR